MSLEAGNIGSQSPLFPGVVNDSLVAFGGRAVAGSDAIRVLALDPAIIGVEHRVGPGPVRRPLDHQRDLDRRPTRRSPTAWQSFQNGDSAHRQHRRLQAAAHRRPRRHHLQHQLHVPDRSRRRSTARPRSTRRTGRSCSSCSSSRCCSSSASRSTRSRRQQPGSLLVPGLRPSGGTRTEGILITRLRFDQQRAEFERNINYMLLNVEYAYWNLYGAYYTLYSREQGLRYALVSWQVNKTRFEAGRIPIQDLEQTRAQYELFRAQRFTALGRVLDGERQLRGLIGLPVEDGRRLVPSDAPTLAAFTPDWPTAVNEALALRPELVLARQDLKFRQLDLIAQKNALKPDLRFFATYDINGLGTRLDGGATRFAGTARTPTATGPLTEPGNALTSLTDNKFNSWELGLRMDVPIGFRDAHAAVRAAQLNLKRSYYQLKDTEQKARVVPDVAVPERHPVLPANAGPARPAAGQRHPA